MKSKCKDLLREKNVLLAMDNEIVASFFKEIFKEAKTVIVVNYYKEIDKLRVKPDVAIVADDLKYSDDCKENWSIGAAQGIKLLNFKAITICLCSEKVIKNEYFDASVRQLSELIAILDLVNEFFTMKRRIILTSNRSLELLYKLEKRYGKNVQVIYGIPLDDYRAMLFVIKKTANWLDVPKCIVHIITPYVIKKGQLLNSMQKNLEVPKPEDLFSVKSILELNELKDKEGKIGLSVKHYLISSKFYKPFGMSRGFCLCEDSFSVNT